MNLGILKHDESKKDSQTSSLSSTEFVDLFEINSEVKDFLTQIQVDPPKRVVNFIVLHSQKTSPCT